MLDFDGAAHRVDGTVKLRKQPDTDQARRLLATARAYEGRDRSASVKLRDWVRRFDAAEPEGLIDRKPAGAARRLTPEQEAELVALIEAGSDFARDGAVSV